MRGILLLFLLVLPVQAQHTRHQARCQMCMSNHLISSHGVNGWNYSNPWSVHKGVHQKAAKPKPLAKPRLPFDPTPVDQVAALVKIVKPVCSDVIYDPGCGDGRLLIALCRDSGATGVGCEINADIAKLARSEVKKAKLENQITIWTADSRKVTADHATLVVCYLSTKL